MINGKTGVRYDRRNVMTIVMICPAQIMSHELMFVIFIVNIVLKKLKNYFPN